MPLKHPLEVVLRHVIFGSRAGLFDAVGADLFARAGFDRIVAAVGHPDAREHLRRGIAATAQAYAAIRDVARALSSMALLDPEAVGGAVARIDADRSGGMDYLARRLAEQHLLRPEVSQAKASNLLWVLTSFDAFDLLYTGRGMSADQAAELLIMAAERALYT